jgi:LEA14-like dessication related protein
MSERWEIDVMRNVIFSTLLVAAACTSTNQLSQNVAHIPQPEITIIGRTDMTNVPTVASGIEAHFEFRIVNQADIPITLRRIDLDTLGGGGINIEAKNRQFNIVIQPHTVGSADFMTTAFINDPNNFSGRSPVQIRAVALFDSPAGSLQKVVQQQVRPEGSD